MSADFCCCAGCGVTVVGAAGGNPHWDVVNGTAPTIETSTVRTAGRHAYRCNTVGAAANRHLRRTTSGTNASARMAFRFATLPDQDTTIIGWSVSAGSAPYIRVKTTGVVTASIAANEGTTFAISTGVWYIVEVKADVSSGTRSISARIKAEGGAYTDLGTVTAAIAAGTLASFRAGVGCGVEATPAQCDLIWTDMLSSNAAADYPLGDGLGVTLRPNGDGTHSFNAVTDFKYNNSVNMPSTSPTDTYTYIDDMVDNITDFLAAAGAATGEYLEWTFSDLPSVTSINGLEVVSSHHAAGTLANTQTLRLVDGGTTNDVFADLDLSQTTITINAKHYATAPSSGAAWTKAKVDALLIRWASSFVAADISPIPFIDAIALEVDYIPAVAGRRRFRIVR